MTPLAIAFSMLTTLPFFKIKSIKQGNNGKAVGFYPLVGLVLGFIVYFAWILLGDLLPQTHLKVLLFVFFIILYGAIHLDGFADTVDGLFVYEKEKALEVMKDPNIGAMGAIFVFLFLIAKLSSFLALDDLFLFVLVPMLSRYGAVIAIKKYDYVRKDGIATLAKNELPLKIFILSSLFVFIVGVLIDFEIFLVLFIFVIIFTFILCEFFKRKYDGLSGDMYGFIIELNELLLLNILIVAL
ncbi:MAG: adenosylcobinamide-GDP ribazoletransferase [Campylobacterota bacterium]|nr:adenosylcobinamide-GDP ribazoletransferase [Campylobacterota bacterium]